MDKFFHHLQRNPYIINATRVTLEESREKLTKTISKVKLAVVEQYCSKTNIIKIAYRSQNHKVIGYLVMPKNIRGKLPCIIFNRGGSQNFGMIADRMLFIILPMIASWGYVVIASQYSGNDGGEGVDEFGGSDIHDVLILYRILKHIPNTDAKRIGIYGGSRGGMMTYLALARTRWFKAAVIVAGPTDLTRVREFRPEMTIHYKKMFGGSLKEKKKRSALYWADKLSKKTPILIMHGSADWRVNPQDSIDLSKKLLEYKIPHRLIIFEGADHGLTEARKESWNFAREWFDRFVKHQEKLPNLKPHGV